MNNNLRAGLAFAFAAAAINASVGIFSKGLLNQNVPASAISFYKCFLGFIILLAVTDRKNLFQHRAKFAFCAFLGIFVLFFFETHAYDFDLTPNIIFVLMGSAAISTFIFGRIFLNDALTKGEIIGLLVCLSGLILLLGVSSQMAVNGLLLACIAGCGYGGFSVAAKKLNLGGGFEVTRNLLGYGSLFLFVPFAFDGFYMPTSNQWLPLIGLALLPSIGGFYCTTKAIDFLKPSQVQMAELTEPIFAILFSFIFLFQLPNTMQLLGGALVICGLTIANKLKF